MSQTNHRYFEFSNGDPYFPIGENICWGSMQNVTSFFQKKKKILLNRILSQATYDYDNWFPKLAANGGCYSRFDSK